MTRDHAIALMKIYQQISIAFNEATEIIAREPNTEEQRLLRLPLGKLMSTLYTELQLPIIRQYPDLDPNRRA